MFGNMPIAGTATCPAELCSLVVHYIVLEFLRMFACTLKYIQYIHTLTGSTNYMRRNCFILSVFMEVDTS